MSCSGRFEQQIDGLGGQLGTKAGMLAEGLRQQPHIVLGAQDMVAGLVVAGFGKRGKGMDGDVLDQFVLPGTALHLLLQEGVLVVQQISRRFQLQVVSDPRQHDGGSDRLVDVVDGPQRQAVRLRTLLHLGGQEDHRDLPRLRHLLQRLHHLIAIHLGHHHVEQDQVYPGAGREDLQRPLAADGDLDPVVRAEQGAEQGEVLRCVIDHQQGGFGIGIQQVEHDGGLTLG